MTKPWIKKVAKHFTLWFIWYTLNSIQLFGSISSLDSTSWLQLGYNYISLVIVFYGVTVSMNSYYKTFSLQVLYSFRGIKQVRYLTKWQLISCFFIAIAYVGTSIYLDKNFFGYKYENLVTHISQRFTRVLPYILVAALYSYLNDYKRRAAKYKIYNDKRFNIIRADNRKVKALIKQYCDEKLLN